MTMLAAKMIVNARCEEVLRLVPHQQKRRLRRGQAIVRQLHHERDRVAAEGRFAERQRENDGDENAEQIQAGHCKRAIARKERRQ